MMFRKMLFAALALPALSVITQPTLAQGGSALFSSSYNFLKAVKDRDFNKTVEAMNGGPTIIASKDDATGETALHIVTRGRDVPWMNFIMQSGADVNARDKTGGSALMVAADQRFLDGARVLVARGAKVNLPNRNGETPLIRAVQLKDQTLVRFLIENGADPDTQDSLAGYSARDYAERDARNGPIAQIIKNAGKAETKPAAATPPPGGR